VLDDKNGFKIFKLNEEKTNYINNLNLIETKNDISTYNYIKGDDDLFDLFGNKINSIFLIFENKTDKLKKIKLVLSERYNVNYLSQLGWYLKKLYYSFEEIIGPTTNALKPSNNCKNLNETCIYFEDKVFDGKIIWEGKSVCLKIIHKTEYDIDNNGNVKLLVIKEVIFEDKIFELTERNSRF
jgi:hypothetical protein